MTRWMAFRCRNVNEEQRYVFGDDSAGHVGKQMKTRRLMDPSSEHECTCRIEVTELRGSQPGGRRGGLKNGRTGSRAAARWLTKPSCANLFGANVSLAFTNANCSRFRCPLPRGGLIDARRQPCGAKSPGGCRALCSSTQRFRSLQQHQSLRRHKIACPDALALHTASKTSRIELYCEHFCRSGFVHQSICFPSFGWRCQLETKLL